MNEKPIIIKIGTQVLTTEQGTLDTQVVSDVVRQISMLYREGKSVILVTSGAAACGREMMCFLGERSPIIQKQMLTAIGQARLMKVYGECFNRYGIPVAQALLERYNFSDRKRYINLKHTLEGLLKHKVIPIINENDVIATRELRFGDNDELACLLSIALEAQMLVICSDVDGLFTNDPRIDSQASLIPLVESVTDEVQKLGKHSGSGLGLGGMMSKLRVAKIVTYWGIETWIVKGKRKNSIYDIFSGQGYGTRFLASKKPARDFQRWLSSSALSSGGVMYVDKGAAEAIRKRKSLLIVGIRDVDGEFEKGDIVDIYLKDERIAVGITNYSYSELKEYLQSLEKEKKNLKEVIDTDNIVLVP